MPTRWAKSYIRSEYSASVPLLMEILKTWKQDPPKGLREVETQVCGEKRDVT